MSTLFIVQGKIILKQVRQKIIIYSNIYLFERRVILLQKIKIMIIKQKLRKKLKNKKIKQQ